MSENKNSSTSAAALVEDALNMHVTASNETGDSAGV